MAKIDIRHKVWVNDETPDIMASNLNDNQQALEKCVEVANKFNGITNVINEDGYNYPKERYLVASKKLKDITKALTDKGVDSTGLFKNVPDEIRSIECGGGEASPIALYGGFISQDIKLLRCPLEGGGGAGPSGPDSKDGLLVTLPIKNMKRTQTEHTINKQTVEIVNPSTGQKTTKEITTSEVNRWEYELPPQGSGFIRDNRTLLTDGNVVSQIDTYNWNEDYSKADVTTSYEYLPVIPEGVFQTGEGWYAVKRLNTSTGEYEAIVYAAPGYMVDYGRYGKKYGNSPEPDNEIFRFDKGTPALGPAFTVFKDFEQGDIL